MIKKTYAKGSRAERELLHWLNSKDWACIRAGSSGGTISPVDVVAMKNGNILCFEIKSWAKEPRLDKGQLSRFSGWCGRAGGIGLLAWYNTNQWRFLPLKDVLAGNYEDWLSLQDFMRVFL